VACRLPLAVRAALPGAGLLALIRLPAGAHGGGCSAATAPANTWGWAADELGADAGQSPQIEATRLVRSGVQAPTCSSPGRPVPSLRWALNRHARMASPPRWASSAHRAPGRCGSASSPRATAGGIRAGVPPRDQLRARALRVGSAGMGQGLGCCAQRRRSSLWGAAAASGRPSWIRCSPAAGLQPHQRTQQPSAALLAPQAPGPAQQAPGGGRHPTKKTSSAARPRAKQRQG